VNRSEVWLIDLDNCGPNYGMDKISFRDHCIGKDGEAHNHIPEGKSTKFKEIYDILNGV
jgi:hypothetical protein